MGIAYTRPSVAVVSFDCVKWSQIPRKSFRCSWILILVTNQISRPTKRTQARSPLVFKSIHEGCGIAVKKREAKFMRLWCKLKLARCHPSHSSQSFGCPAVEKYIDGLLDEYTRRLSSGELFPCDLPALRGVLDRKSLYTMSKIPTNIHPFAKTSFPCWPFPQPRLQHSFVGASSGRPTFPREDPQLYSGLLDTGQ